MKAEEIINWTTLSKALSGRGDIIRSNRIAKQYKGKVKELEDYITYWLTTIKPPKP